MSGTQQEQFVHTRTTSRDSNNERTILKNNSIEREDPISIAKENDVRRDSSGSNDSSGKKQASLNEIQDLYSALQDLVKTNVTTTPSVVRHQQIFTSNPEEKLNSPARLSPRIEKSPRLEKLRINEPALLIIDPKEKKLRNASKSSSAIVASSEKEKNMKHKRGNSTGNLETMKMKNKSPFSNRRHSSETEIQEKSSRSSSSTTDKLKKEMKLLRSGSNSDVKSKRWRPKLFSRLRTKNSHSSIDDEDEICCSDGSSTPPSLSYEKNRRLSEADVIRVEIAGKSSSNKQSTCPPMRKQRKELSSTFDKVETKNVKHIDQLVASLSLEYDGEEKNTNSGGYTSVKSPERELSKLESWFEKAAAEAVLYQFRGNLNEKENYDGDQVKRMKCEYNENTNEGRKKSGTRNKSATVKRGHSHSHIMRDEKRLLNLKDNTLDRLRVNSLGQLHARSTPNLNGHGSQSDLSDNELIENLCRKTPSPNENRKNICLAEPGCRLPKTPLFYVPNDEQSSQNALKIVSKSKFGDSEVFFTVEKELKEEKDLKLNWHFKKSESVNEPRRVDASEDGSTRSKTFSSPNVFMQLQIETNKMKTDDNANFCQPSLEHNLEDRNLSDITDISHQNVPQDKPLWNRFGSIEDKAIMA